MNLLAHLFALCLVLLMLIACTSAQPLVTPDPDALRLITMSEQARQIAKKELPDAVLRQITTDTDLNKPTFWFTDSAATKEIHITASAPNVPPEQWLTQVISPSYFRGWSAPDINLQVLRVGPSRVAQAISTHWAGCKVRFLLLGQEEGDVVWIAFCDTPQGLVSGKVDIRTGVFQPSNAPPARMPITATPVR